MSFQMDAKAILNDFQEDVQEATQKAIQSVAKQAVKKLKNESPKRTGKYAKGWAVETEKGRVSFKATVYGKSGTYQLAHLLENGHAKRGGGRVPGIEHIAPVEQWATNEVQKEIKQRIER
jgi:hypothetical protein